MWVDWWVDWMWVDWMGGLDGWIGWLGFVSSHWTGFGTGCPIVRPITTHSHLRHTPHIPPNLTPASYTIYIYIPAQSLYDLLRTSEAPLAWEELKRLARQIALGIYYLHTCRPPVLHLDLKSANVLLDEHGTAKVIRIYQQNISAVCVCTHQYCTFTVQSVSHQISIHLAMGSVHQYIHTCIHTYTIG